MQGWGGCYVELQIGIAPSQLHTFPLPARTSHHHSEYYMLMRDMPQPDASELWADDYRRAVDAASAFVRSDRGMPEARWVSADSWLAKVADRPLQPLIASGDASILFNGSAWGGHHARLSKVHMEDTSRGTPLPSNMHGALQVTPPSVVYFEHPTSQVAGANEDTRAWAELLETHRFSNHTLGSIPGGSFVAGSDPRWASLIIASAERHGWTWLHHLHAGLESAERADVAGAASHFRSSQRLRPNAHALRCLATLEVLPDTKVGLYKAAWDSAGTVTSTSFLGTFLADVLSSTPPRAVCQTYNMLAIRVGCWLVLAIR